MRIALIVPGGVDRSGTERVIPALLSLIERLARRHEVSVVALAQESEPGTWPLLGATVHNLGVPAGGIPGTTLLRFAPRLAGLLSRIGPFDVVQAFWAGTPALLAALATLGSGTPLAVHVSGGELAALRDIGYGGYLHRRERLKTRFALSRAARITCGSRFLQTRLAAENFKAGIVPLGVDTALFAPGPPRDEPPTRLLHVASLNEVKDQATLLRAFRRVADAEPGVTLEVVGEDTLGGGVQREASRLGLARRVVFHGFLPQGELVGLVQRTDLFVQSSRWEAQGVAVLEAASCGIPTAGTAVGLVADLAPDAAVEVPVGDDAALSEAILALFRDGERRRRLGEAARAFSLAHDADATARSFERLYSDLRTS
ncbi:MAG: glycosyltransferase family 4 protein [Thermoanaerobaculia bacterium]